MVNIKKYIDAIKNSTQINIHWSDKAGQMELYIKIKMLGKFWFLVNVPLRYI